MAVNISRPVLVVEDHPATTLILRALLKRLGFEDVDEATDGSAALVKIRAKHYALVISDWNMEPMTGHELLQEVRADERLAKVRFVMITADMNASNIIAAKQAGVSSFIVKPFSAETLMAKIEEAFALI
jgi:two-component system, chemotaxis family, chemotaxis protein CheY